MWNAFHSVTITVASVPSIVALVRLLIVTSFVSGRAGSGPSGSSPETSTLASASARATAIWARVVGQDRLAQGSLRRDPVPAAKGDSHQPTSRGAYGS